jgi:hypothetical protein
MKEGKAAILIQERAAANKRSKTFEKPLSLLLQQLKTTIIFQKDMQYLQMLIIFYEQQYFLLK